MPREFDHPFASIESAQEFFGLVIEAVVDTRESTASDLQTEAESRRADAMRLVLYKLEKLEKHLTTSRRLLNDLRTLRRLLLEERTATADRAKAS